jgi:hypothetical protein
VKEINMSKYSFTYDLKQRDVAAHNDIIGEGYFEWWYLDAVFDNGYELVGDFIAGRADAEIAEFLGMPQGEKGGYPYVEFRITTPDHKSFDIAQSVPPEKAKLSNDTLDLVVGSNSLLGEFEPSGLLKKFHLKLSQGDMGVDVTYYTEVTGVKLANRDGGFTYYNPVKKKYYGWYPVAPRNRVEGTLTVQGKKIPVKGWGYQDHQSGNYPTMDAMPIEFWGHGVAGEYTMIWTDSFAGENKDYRHFSPFVLWKGKTPILNTYDFCCVPEKFEMDPDIRMPYPYVESLRASDGKTSVRVILKPGKLIHKWRYQSGKRLTKEHPGSYFRQVCDSIVEITQGEEVERVHGQALHEHMWHMDWFPYEK